MTHPRRQAAAVVSALLTLTMIAGPVSADDFDEQRRAAQERSAQTDRQIEALEASIEGLDAQLGQAVLDLQATQSRLPLARAELAAANQALDTAQREATLIAARLQDAQDQVTTITETIAGDQARGKQVRASIGQMARQAYKGDRATTGLGVVMGADSTEDFVDQYGMVSTAMRTQSQVLDELRQLEAANRNNRARLDAVRERVTELKAEADQKVTEADQARAAAQDRQAEIEQLIAEQAAHQATIAGMKETAEAQQTQLEGQQAAIESELQAIIAAERAAAQQAAAAAAAAKAAEEAAAAQRRQQAPGGPAPVPAPAPAAPQGAAQAPSGSLSGAMFSNPTSIDPIYVTSEYGMRLHPILGYRRLHAGIDLRTYCNTPLYAPRDATVRWSQWRGGFGNQVMLDYGYLNGNSVMSSSNHLTRSVVSDGQRVSRGQLIGYAGNTGLSGACHLHFEVYLNGATTNPRPLLGL